MIGDCHTAALVSKQGSIDWLCFPHFDSGACFAALLGTPENGHWSISPAGPFKATRRRYREGTLILETEFDTDSGSVTLIDCMSPRDGTPSVLRMVVGTRGRVQMDMELVIRFDYGSVVPWVRRTDQGISAIAGPDMLGLRTEVELHGENFKTVATFTISEGQKIPFDLTWYPSQHDEPAPVNVDTAIQDTENWWREWSDRCSYQGQWRDAVLRSLITLLQVGSKAGFAMVFALLVAAIIWNLSTWYFGLPASSSHTLIGSIIGVGIANQLMSARTGTSGVDWGQALNIGKSLLLSPIVGFAVAGLLLLAMKAVIKNRKLYEAPEGTEPPPFWIRALLVLTCTGVSFAHGSNDGQKGMGLIMLILIGTVPTAYALNHAVTKKQSQDFIAFSQQAANTLDKYVSPNAVIADSREEVTTFIRTREFTPNTMLALRQLVSDIGNETVLFGELAKVPNDRVRNFRNDMYLVSEALRLMQKTHQPDISAADWQVLTNYKKHIDNATKFIPGWVKVAVAMALGLGTMVGWKRIVVTVGEKIGKDHLTYGQGAAAEITAMFTIGAADWFGLPVSTTHVLSSGIAGTMAANHTGLQWATVRNLAMAWVLTLPVSMMLAGFLFWGFRNIF